MPFSWKIVKPIMMILKQMESVFGENALPGLEDPSGIGDISRLRTSRRPSNKALFPKNASYDKHRKTSSAVHPCRGSPGNGNGGPQWRIGFTPILSQAFVRRFAGLCREFVLRRYVKINNNKFNAS
jgi:hypothetical protein